MYGFTLVELLIAMTLTAVIGMVLFSTYSMAVSYTHLTLPTNSRV